MLSIRQNQILKDIVESRSVIPIEHFMFVFNLSKRTIQYDLQSINDYLIEKGLSELILDRGNGFKINQLEQNKVTMLLNLGEKETVIYDKSERFLRILYIVLANVSNNIDYFSEINNVSRNTTLSDIKSLKAYCRQYSTTLEYQPKFGYILQGEEMHIRFVLLKRCFMYFESKYFHHLLDVLDVLENNIFDDMRKIDDLLSENRLDLHFTLSDEMKNKISLVIYTMMFRIKNDNILIESGEKKLVSEEVLRECSSIFEKMDKKVEPAELAYLGKFLLSANKIKSDVSISNTIETAIGLMISKFIELSNFEISNKTQLQEDLRIHVEALYYRVLFDVEWITPIGYEIEDRYFDIYYYTNKVVEPINKLVGKTISKNEISYIALIFGANIISYEETEKVRVGIVSEKGKSTTRLLFLQVSRLIGENITLLNPITVSEFTNIKDWKVNYIISTYPIKTNNAQVILVDPILGDGQREQIRSILIPDKNKLNTSILVNNLLEIINKHTKILNYDNLIDGITQVLDENFSNRMINKDKDFFPINHIKVIDQVSDWKEAIRLASQPLINDGSFKQKYVDAMIKQIHTMGPYVIISPGIAFPHASKDDGALRAALSILKLNKPISFSEDEKHQVKLVIVISSTNDYEELVAMRQLIELINSTNFLENISSKHDKYEIKKYINSIINFL